MGRRGAESAEINFMHLISMSALMIDSVAVLHAHLHDLEQPDPVSAGLDRSLTASCTRSISALSAPLRPTVDPCEPNRRIGKGAAGQKARTGALRHRIDAPGNGSAKCSA